MNCEIISVGTELLLGDIVNTDAQFLARELAAIGISVYYQSTVGDNEERLAAAVKGALSRSDIVITTGGLGPTKDDLTKEVTCAVMGAELAEHEESVRHIEAYFRRLGKGMDDTNMKQAMLPKGGVVFHNDYGTAPGCAVEVDGKIAIMLPGPPSELKPMFLNHVKPYLTKLSGMKFISHNIQVFGIGEAKMATMVKDLLDMQNPTVAPYAKSGESLLRVTAAGKDEQECEELAKPVIENILNRLGDAVYGIDCGSLQAKVVELLTKHKMHVAVAESCTAGLLCKRITEFSGSSGVFEYGIVSYSNEIKQKYLSVPAEVLGQYGAVSPQTAIAMAQGALRAGGADIGVGITGIAGPDGGSERKPVGLSYAAVCDKSNAWVREIRTGRSMSGDREYNRYVTSSNALDMLRKYLSAYPELPEGEEL